MYSYAFTVFGLVSIVKAIPHAAPHAAHEHSHHARYASSGLPFTKIVAFGDDFTDDGSGSYAHGITGNPDGSGAKMWGNGTMTDGPVAVSYLEQALGIPLSTNYAFGSSGGAATLGSVCDNSLIPSNQQSSHAKLKTGQIVPAALDQVNQYTSGGSNDAGNTLHFFWTGNNDVIASLGWLGRFTICSDGKCSGGEQQFAQQLVSCMTKGIQNLVDKGAKHIIVPNVYPRHLAPWTSMWISSDSGHISNYGSVIDAVNTQLKSSIQQINAHCGSNVMYYDANAWMQAALKNTKMAGIAGTGGGYTDTCVDGCTKQIPGGTSNWNLYWQNTITNHEPDYFYWMTEVVPSTTVMKSIANDMAGFLKSQKY